MNPLASPSAYDVAILAGSLTPGLCVEVAGASNPRKWDKQDGKGQSGASIVYNGDGLAAFSIKLHLWLAEHFDAWDTFKALLAPPTEKNPQALEIYHPTLDALPVPITAVVVEDVMAPKLVDDTGIWEVEIKLTQYRAAKPAGGKPAGAKSGGGKDGSGKGAGASPGSAGADDIDKMISDMTSEVSSLASG